MNKYLVNIVIRNVYTGAFDQGCYSKSFATLDEVRDWVKTLAKKGDKVVIQPNGKDGSHAKILIVE